MDHEADTTPKSASVASWRLSVVVGTVGVLLLALSGCTSAVESSSGATSPQAPSPTFSDGSPMPGDLIATGEACNQLYPFDDEAFLECVLRARYAAGSRPPSSADAKSPPSATLPSSTTTSTIVVTTTADVPAHVVAGPVVACPDFIEATFRNVGGRSVKIVEIAIFLGVAGEPFGYGTDWTPTIDPGAAATWRASAADLGLEWIGPGAVSIGARPSTSKGEFVYADGSNPHESCATTAPTTTTTAFSQAPNVDVSESEAMCKMDGATFTFRITNTGSTNLALYQVALFPYQDGSHAFYDVDSWWPLPDVPPGETVEHSDVFVFGESWGESIELYVASSNGVTMVDIQCS